MLPSHISGIIPKKSIFDNALHETVARNIAVTLVKTGNRFRRLLWREYVAQLMKDMRLPGPNHPVILEQKQLFIQVVPHLASEKKARAFSPLWNLPKSGEHIILLK